MIIKVTVTGGIKDMKREIPITEIDQIYKKANYLFNTNTILLKHKSEKKEKELIKN